MTFQARSAAAVLAAAAAGVTLAWAFGLPELTAFSVAAAAALLAGGWWARFRALRPSVALAVRPGAVGVGEDASLVIKVANRASRTTAPVRIHGRLGTAGDGILAVTPLAPGTGTELVVALPTLRRGVVHIADLWCTTTDPLGWWQDPAPVASAATLLVRPRVHPLVVDGFGAGVQLSPVGAGGRGHGGSAADELVGLRPYVRGDDLRLIHWRTSARRHHPHVVQAEPPARTPAVVVVLDNRAETQAAPDFERAVEAAASVVAHVGRRGHVARLLTGDGWDSGPVEPEASTDLLDALAAVDRRHGTRLEAAVEAAGESAEGGAVMVCTGTGAPLSVRAPGRGTRLMVLCCGTNEVRTDAVVVRWRGGDSLQAAFDAATRPTGTAAATPSAASPQSVP